MAIQQTKKQSDLEKRLQLLHRQVYGKNSEILRNTQKYSDSQNLRESDNQNFRFSDTNYLRQDLLKIFTFSSAAIGIQLLLFFILKNRILNLKLF